MNHIGTSAFQGCSSIVNLTIPSSLNNIGDVAFRFCSSLESIDFEGDEPTVGNNVFIDVASGCKAYVDGTLPGWSQHPNGSDWNGLTIVYKEPVQAATRVKYTEASGITPREQTLDIEGELTRNSIPNISNVEEVDIGNAVTSIGYHALYNGTSIRRVTIPSSVTSIESQTFVSCSGLEEISVSDDNPNYASVNGMLLSKDGTMLVQGVNGTITIPNGVKDIWNFAFYNLRGLTSVAIPDSVTRIRAAVFSGCTGLTGVTIPSSVTFIGFDAFCRSGLTSVTIPDSVTRLEDSSFLGCTNLTSVTIGNGLTNIEKNMFSGCIGLTGVTIPNGITSIEENAFKDCTTLASVVFEGDEPTLGTDVFANVASGCKAYVDGTMDGWSQYPDGSNWNGLTIVYKEQSATRVKYTEASRITPREQTFNIEGELRSISIPNRKSIEEVDIGSAVTSIGDDAFCNCSGLTSVTIPNSVTSIGGGACGGCSRLTNVTIGAGVTSIGFGAFSNCNDSLYDTNSISGVKLVDGWAVDYTGSLSRDLNLIGIRGIGDSAFKDCSGLTSVTIPNSVTSIGSCAFQNCRGLTSVTIPSSVTSIGKGAFDNCRGLTSVTIPDGVTSIGAYAFYNCRGLTSVTIGNSVKSIGSYAFYYCDSLTSVIFEGDEPTLGTNAFTNVYVFCKAYVNGTLPGWSQYPNGSNWNGLTITYKNVPAEPEYHTITFVCDSTRGTMSGQATQQVESGQSATPPTVTANTGWSCTGWSSNAWQNASGDATVEATFDAIEYAISYNLGGHGTLPANATTRYTIESATVTPPTLSEEGWTFNGWTPTSIPSGSTGNKTFTASWSQVVPQTSTHMVRNSVGFDVALQNDATQAQVTLPGEYGGTTTTEIPDGTYTIKRGTMSGMDVNGTTYSENSTITIDSDIEMTKHEYSLPQGWEDEIDQQFPEIDDSDAPDEGEDEEPEQPHTSNQTIIKVNATENNLEFGFYLGLHLVDDNDPGTIDWGDGQTTLVETNGTPTTHTYAQPGEYTIAIEDKFWAIGMNKAGGSVQRIGDMVTEVVELGSNIAEIIPFSFAFCTHIDHIEFPEGLEYIYEKAFHGCSNLKTITFRGKTPPLDLYEGAFGEDASEAFHCGYGVADGKTVYVP